MMWQDILIAVGGWVMVAALIPTLVGTSKPAISSSILLGAVLSSYAFAYFTLDLFNAALVTAAQSILWLALAWQAWRMRRTGA